MAIDKPRIVPLPMSEWGEPEKKALSVFVKPGGKSVQGGDSSKSKDMSALAVFLNHPELAGAVFPLTRHLLYDSCLSPRDRELLVLRVASMREAEYEWAQHVIIAQNCGVTDEEIKRVPQSLSSADWSAKDRLLMVAVDELLADAELSDTTWGGLAQHYDEPEMMEIVVTVGAYVLMAMAFKSFGLQLSAELKEVIAEFPIGG